MPFLEAGDIRMYVEEKGSGDTVLYINGSGGDLRIKPNFLDGPLADAFHVIGYDQRGLGQTDKPEGPYTMAQYGDDAAALLDALGIDGRVFVVGASFGGMVAQHFAIRHPDRISRMVICCASPGGSLPSYPFHELQPGLDPVERMLQLMSVSDTRRDEAWQKENPDRVQKLIDFTRAGLIEDHQLPDSQRGYQLQIEARSRHDTLADLPSIEIPTLICAGRYDGIAPPANQYKLQELIPGSELNWYEGGHLFLIQDKQAWKDIVSFLVA